MKFFLTSALAISMLLQPQIAAASTSVLSEPSYQEDLNNPRIFITHTNLTIYNRDVDPKTHPTLQLLTRGGSAETLTFDFPIIASAIDQKLEGICPGTHKRIVVDNSYEKMIDRTNSPNEYRMLVTLPGEDQSEDQTAVVCEETKSSAKISKSYGFVSHPTHLHNFLLTLYMDDGKVKCKFAQN